MFCANDMTQQMVHMTEQNSKEFSRLIEQASAVYHKHHPPTTCFERALFFSWWCGIKDCTFCFMSTQEHATWQEARRSFESIIAEAIIAKAFGWPIGFVSGGVGVLGHDDFVRLVRMLSAVLDKKVWLNGGLLAPHTLEACKPYIEGIICSVETVNPELHDKVCPSKPLAPIEHLFDTARSLDIRCGMTCIVGIGETLHDVNLLIDFIQKHNISKIHIYGLIPQKGTVFEHTSPPSAEYQAGWIARIRIAFPHLDIQCGIWKDRPEYTYLLLSAGANSISKFPAIRAFNSWEAREIEAQARRAGRSFQGTLTAMVPVDLDAALRNLDADEKVKKKIRFKCGQYLAKMGRNPKTPCGEMPM